MKIYLLITISNYLIFGFLIGVMLIIDELKSGRSNNVKYTKDDYKSAFVQFLKLIVTWFPICIKETFFNW